MCFRENVLLHFFSILLSPFVQTKSTTRLPHFREHTAILCIFMYNFFCWSFVVIICCCSTFHCMSGVDTLRYLSLHKRFGIYVLSARIFGYRLLCILLQVPCVRWSLLAIPWRTVAVNRHLHGWMWSVLCSSKKNEWIFCLFNHEKIRTRRALYMFSGSVFEILVHNKCKIVQHGWLS